MVAISRKRSVIAINMALEIPTMHTTKEIAKRKACRLLNNDEDVSASAILFSTARSISVLRLLSSDLPGARPPVSSARDQRRPCEYIHHAFVIQIHHLDIDQGVFQKLDVPCGLSCLRLQFLTNLLLPGAKCKLVMNQHDILQGFTEAIFAEQLLELRHLSRIAAHEQCRIVIWGLARDGHRQDHAPARQPRSARPPPGAAEIASELLMADNGFAEVRHGQRCVDGKENLQLIREFIPVGLAR